MGIARPVATLITALGLALGGCGGDGGGTVDPPTGQRGTLTGTVTDGSPVAQVQVSVTRSGHATRTATSGSNGRFQLADLEAGTWQANVVMPSTHESDPAHVLPVGATIAAGQATDITLRIRRVTVAEAASIGGRVRNGASGVAGASLELAGPGGSRTATTASTGTYSFPDLGAGAYTVSLTVPTGFQLAASEQASKQVTVVAGQAATIDFSVTQQSSGPVTTITLGDFFFSPATITVQRGTRVRWTNPTGMFHTVTPNGHSEWSSANLSAGQQFEHVFNTAGTFAYYCDPHRGAGMTGVINVQ